MAQHLNRKPSTLRNRDHRFYDNLWRCASSRARNTHDNELAGREYSSAHALYTLARAAEKPAFKVSLPDGLGSCNHEEPSMADIFISRDDHIQNAMNGQAVTVPDYVSELMCDEPSGWEDKVCAYLQAVHDSNETYTWDDVTVGSGESDILGEITVTIFIAASDNKGDKYWSNCYVSIDGILYDPRDSTVANCGILTDTIGWYVATLDDEQLPDDCRTDRYSHGYTSNPLSEVEADLIGTPVWHHALGCFVGRLRTYSQPVKICPDFYPYGG